MYVVTKIGGEFTTTHDVPAWFPQIQLDVTNACWESFHSHYLNNDPPVFFWLDFHKGIIHAITEHGLHLHRQFCFMDFFGSQTLAETFTLRKGFTLAEEGAEIPQSVLDIVAGTGSPAHG